MSDTTQRMEPLPTWRCRIGRHSWHGTHEHRRCDHCLKIQIRCDVVRDGRSVAKWYTRHQHNMTWCDCGNELVGCPDTGCWPIDGGVSRVMYSCGRCHRNPVFDYGIAPVAIKVESDDD